MKENPLPKIASVEAPFGCQPPRIHCPLCGKPMLNEDGEPSPCKHLAFIFFGVNGKWHYQSKDFAKRISKLDESLAITDLATLLKELKYGKSLLGFEVTYGGMACGPVWFTDCYGFRLRD